MALIMLDKDGNVVREMLGFEPPHTIMQDNRLFDYEGMDGNDFIFRERPPEPHHHHEM
jgi:hypothetical protein